MTYTIRRTKPSDIETIISLFQKRYALAQRLFDFVYEQHARLR